MMHAGEVSEMVVKMRAHATEASAGEDVHRNERELRWMWEALDALLSNGVDYPAQWEYGR